MASTVSICAVFLAQALAGNRGQETPAEAPPRSGIGGLAGFAAVTEVRFETDPALSHVLDIVYIFPDRARWSLSASSNGSHQREISTRLGERAWRVEGGSPASRALGGPDRDVMLLQMELRRAAFFWPDGFPWTDDPDGSRSAPVTRSTSESSAQVGKLVAFLDRRGSLQKMQAFRSDGQLQEALVVNEWKEDKGRRWPQKMCLEQNGLVVWRESLIRIDTQLHYADLYFLPPDVRGGGKVHIVGNRTIVSTDLRGFTYRTRPLDPGSTWDDSTRLALKWIAEENALLRPQGIQLDPIPTFELSADGKPLRCLLRLQDQPKHPLEGWTTVHDRPGLAILLPRPEDLDRSVLNLLERAVPPGCAGGSAYARAVNGIQVYLPLESD